MMALFFIPIFYSPIRSLDHTISFEGCIGGLSQYSILSYANKRLNSCFLVDEYFANQNMVYKFFAVICKFFMMNDSHQICSVKIM